MASNKAAKLTSGGIVVEDSDTTVEIKIKTLDCQTYTLRVDKCLCELYEIIMTGRCSDHLIESTLESDMTEGHKSDVEDGHALHLVVRQPPQSTTPSTNQMGSEAASVGRAAPVATTNSSEQSTGQREREQTEPARNSAGVNVVHQAFSGRDSGVRVVPPLRTLVAVPSGVNPTPSESSASSVWLFYPLRARVHRTSTGTASETRGSQASDQLSQGAPEKTAYQRVSAVFVSTQQNPLNTDAESRTQADNDTARG